MRGGDPSTYLTVPFFTYVYAILPVWPLWLIQEVAALYVLIFRERLDPRTLIFWIAVVTALPFLGLLMYLAWGCTLFMRRDGSRKAESDAPIMAAEPDPVPEGDARLESILRGAGADAYTGGNLAEVTWNGRDALEGILADLEGARESVYIETIELARNDIGDRMTQTLAARASEGVDVRILTSASGFGRTAGLDVMKKAGARHATLHHRVHSVLSVSVKNRNLRNMIVIDGRVAHIGVSSFVRVEGRGAARAATRFLADWHHATGEDVEPPELPEPAEGGCGVQMVSSGPDSPTDPMLHGYSAMISEARDRLYITFPYLVPTDEVYNSIKQAVIAGTDVRILIPAKCRHWYQPWNSLAAANPLMQAGARVYFAPKSMAKSVVIADGRVCTVGSAVYTSRIWADYAENVVVYSEEAAGKAEEEFLRELEGATECRPEEYEERSLSDMIKIGIARLFMFLNRGPLFRGYLY